MQKIEVNGNKTNPVYKYLKKNQKVENIPWNFAKFLVNKDGDVVAYYPPPTSPTDILKDIKKL
jgi:glutathione peroxidase-family protein